MNRVEMDGLWREACVDLHVAYLATLRIRHERRKDGPAEAARDMEVADPFGLGDPCGAEAVRKWKEIWASHAGGADPVADAAAAGTVAVNNHIGSWSALASAYPGLFQASRPGLLPQEGMTSTAASRESILEKGRRLRTAWVRFREGKV